MKVLFVSPTFPPPPDGLGDYVERIGSRICTDGTVRVLTRRAEGGERRLDRARGLGGEFEVMRWVRSWNLDGAFELARAVRRCRPDLIHLQYVPHGYGRLGFAPAVAFYPLVARLLGARTLTTFHEFDPGARRPFPAFLQTIVLALQGKLLFRLSDAATIVASSFASRCPGDVPLTPVGPTIEPLPLDREEARRRLLASGRVARLPRHLLVGAAAAHPMRRFDVPVRAVRSLRGEGRDVGLLLVGRGFGPGHPDFGAVAVLEEEGGVRRLDEVDASTYSLCLRAADLFVQFHADGATERSTTIANALAHALPCVLARGRDTAPEFEEPQEAVRLVPWGDAEAARAAVAALLDDEGARARASAAAAELSSRRFSWDRVAEEYRRVYRELEAAR